MKKSLIALAVLSAAGAAAAQSSVTLYGRVELGTDTVKSKVTNTATATTIKTSSTDAFGAEGVWAGNRIGLKGTEDLGDGIKLNFNYEMGVNADNVTAGSFSGTTRLANLNLTGGFGSVTIGTFKNPLDKIRGYSGSLAGFSSEWAKGKMGATNVNRIPDRSTNALAYAAKFGPVWLAVGGVHNNTKTYGPQNGVNGAYYTTAKTTGGLIAAGYEDGPINVGAAYGLAKSTTNYSWDGRTIVPNPDPNAQGAARLSTTGKVSDWAVGGTYDLGVAKPWLVYQQVTSKGYNDAAGSVLIGRVTNKAAELGVTVPFDAVKLWVATGIGRTNDRLNWVKEKQTGYELGASYALSKRTSLNGVLLHSAVKQNTNNAAGNLVSSRKTSTNRFAATVVHTF